MDPKERRDALTSGALPAALVEGFFRLCQGEFTYRLPRTLSRDADDTAAFFFNTIADELERLIASSRRREERLTETSGRVIKEILA